ncbi:MAG: aldo/keto reductase [Candidatus Marinimicrobia bacterium]|nr:aldo/keto reductase [Candidatus Neomarinimicrobiota bacterium]MCF7827932.1 aldo/keto reductase [Candidatus Neomarinimicrobiota bacterium]MCF7879313.1 aldo/keto reductase [Candidatus Neomarinimicrobiota bacterium]
MEYRQLGNSELEVSEVGLGTWAMGNDFFGEVDDQESIGAIQMAIDNGINFIDTAPAYGDGHSEEVVGKALKGRRDSVVLATKCGVIRENGKFKINLEPDSVRQEIDDSLRRLDVDVIDLYQIHWPDEDTPIEKTLDPLLKAQEAGKFRYLGLSNFQPDQMDEVRALTDFVSLQPPYSLLKRNIEGGILPYCQQHDIGVVSYGTLAGGILTGKFKEIPEFEEGDHRDHFYKYFQEPTWSKVQKLLDVLREIAAERDVPVTQIAINWATQQPGITTALVGAKNADQAKANAAAGDWKLSDEERTQIAHAYQEIFGK